MRKKKIKKTSAHCHSFLRLAREYSRRYRWKTISAIKGRIASWTGRWRSPQYQERSEKTRSEAANAAGNAKVPKVFLRAGYSESCRINRTTSQQMTERTCDSGLRVLPSFQF
jgi:hypothetical protein